LPYLDILLPIGLSFHTFQAMSYTIEVYRGNFKAERNFGIYSLYVMFYPQLVAGPIERPQNVLPQLHKYHRFNETDFSNGLKLIVWGLFQKVVIADNLSEFVALIYKNAASYTGLAVVVGCIFFSFQIYCDFAGYSNIALGTARVMGIYLMTNFERPYLSQSISEFWSRWHISLSTWFRDYVYIPLGGNRGTKSRTYFNQMTVFLLSGLWHGANWTFVVWGTLHGSYLVIESIAKSSFTLGNWSKTKFFIQVKRLWVFAFVTFAWIFFRAKDFKNAHDVVYKVTHVKFSDWLLPLFGSDKTYSICICFTLIIFLLTMELIQGNKSFLEMINGWSKQLRWAFLLGLIVVFLVLGAFHNSGEFIYFKF